METAREFAADVIDELKSSNEYHKSFYDLIPLEDEIQDEMVKHLYSRLKAKLIKKKLAKTEIDWLIPTRCCIPWGGLWQHYGVGYKYI